jgi:hypothetical protein
LVTTILNDGMTWDGSDSQGTNKDLATKGGEEHEHESEDESPI